MSSNLEYREHHPIDGDLLAEVGRLRVEAWASVIPEAARMGTWIDDGDSDGYHWTVHDGQLLIAAARLSVHASIQAIPLADGIASSLPYDLPMPVGSINRLVVATDYRGKGIAGSLDRQRIERASELGCRSVLGTPIGERRIVQLVALGFKQVAISHGPISHGPISHQHVPILVLEL